MRTTETSPVAGPAPRFGDVDRQVPPTAGATIDFIAVQRSAEFASLRRRLRRFVFPMTAVFFGWYLCYVLLAAYAHDLMSYRLTGQVTVGLALGVLQFGTTILIMLCYLRYARRHLDPQVLAVRALAGEPE